MSNHQISLRQFDVIILVNHSVIVNTVFFFLFRCILESILTSSISAQAIIQLLEKFLHSGEDYFRKPTSQNKKSIRGLARKAKNLKRLDVFKHLREITPRGTTGLLFNVISLNPFQYLSIDF